MSSYYYYNDDDTVPRNAYTNETSSDEYNSNTNNVAMMTMDYYVTEEQKVEQTSLYFVVFSTLLILSLIVCKVLHNHPTIHTYLSEAAVVLMIGMIAGLMINIVISSTTTYSNNEQQQDEYDSYTTKNSNPLSESWLSFHPNIFFMALLPPIIFHSGYQLRRELFYRHITPILLFSIIGTTLAALSTGLILYGILTILTTTTTTSDDDNGDNDNVRFAPTLLELLTFGSLIAATDTVSVLSVFQSKRVDPHLFYLVFGESALNDAVALVLFHTFAKLLLLQQNQDQQESDSSTSTNTSIYHLDHLVTFVLQLIADGILSPILGIVTSFGIAYLFKSIDFRNTTHLELPLYIVLMYIPFVLAECFSLSGIVTIFFSGISARRYIVPNVSSTTATNAEMIFQTSSYVAEICIFIELGLSVFGLPLASYNWYFIVCAFIASLLGRAIGIYPLAFLFNMSLKERIPTTTSTTVGTLQQPLHQSIIPIVPTQQCSRNNNNIDNDNINQNDDLNPSNTNAVKHLDEVHSNNNGPHQQQEQQQQNQQQNLGGISTIKSSDSSSSNGNSSSSSSSNNNDYYIYNEKNNTITKKTKKNKIMTKNKTPFRRRDKIIPVPFMHTIWFVGLRGAVAYACARHYPNVYGTADEMMACTIVIVLISIIGMGSILVPLLHRLQIPINVDERMYMKEWHKERYLKGLFHEYEHAYIYRTVVRDHSNIDNDPTTTITTKVDGYSGSSSRQRLVGIVDTTGNTAANNDDDDDGESCCSSSRSSTVMGSCGGSNSYMNSISPIQAVKGIATAVVDSYVALSDEQSQQQQQLFVARQQLSTQQSNKNHNNSHSNNNTNTNNHNVLV